MMRQRQRRILLTTSKNAYLNQSKREVPNQQQWNANHQRRCWLLSRSERTIVLYYIILVVVLSSSFANNHSMGGVCHRIEAASTTTSPMMNSTTNNNNKVDNYSRSDGDDTIQKNTAAAATTTTPIRSLSSSSLSSPIVAGETIDHNDHQYHKQRTPSSVLSSRLSLSSDGTSILPWQQQQQQQRQFVPPFMDESKTAMTSTLSLTSNTPLTGAAASLMTVSTDSDSSSSPHRTRNRRQIQPGGSTLPNVNMDDIYDSTTITTGTNDISDTNALYSHGNVFDIETKSEHDIVITSLTITTRSPLVGGPTAAVVIYTKSGSYKDDDRLDGTNWDLLATLPLNLLNEPDEIQKKGGGGGTSGNWLSYKCDVDSECLRPLLVKKQSTQTILISMASLDVVYTEHPTYDTSMPYVEDDNLSVYMGAGIGIFPVIFSQEEVYEEFFEKRLWHGTLTYSLIDAKTVAPTMAPTATPTSYPTAVEVTEPHTIRTLTTPLPSSTKGSQGLMFDLSVGALRNVILRGIKISISSTVTEEQMKTLVVYRADQSYVGIESNQESWKEMGVEYVTTESSEGNVRLLEVKVNPIVVNAGATLALYVTFPSNTNEPLDKAILFTSGSTVGEILVEDDDMQIQVGTSIPSYSFGDDAAGGSTKGDVASFNGAIIYSTPTDAPTMSPTMSPTSMGGILETQTKLTIGGLGAARVRQLRRKLAMMDNDETRAYFENVGKSFLGKSVNGQGGPEISVSHYVVSTDITEEDLTRGRRHLGVARHLPNFVRRFLQMEDDAAGGEEDGLSVYQTILGEYSPPPVVDFSSLVENSFDDSGDDFITDLKESSNDLGAEFAEARSVKAETVSFPKPPEIIQALAEYNAPQDSSPPPQENTGPPGFLTYVWVGCGLVAFVVVVVVSLLVVRHRKLIEKKRRHEQQEEEEERERLAAAEEDNMMVYPSTSTHNISAQSPPLNASSYGYGELTKQGTLGTLMSDDLYTSKSRQSLFDPHQLVPSSSGGMNRSSWYDNNGGPTGSSTDFENDPYGNYKRQLLADGTSVGHPSPPQDQYAVYKAQLMDMHDASAQEQPQGMDTPVGMTSTIGTDSLTTGVSDLQSPSYSGGDYDGGFANDGAVTTNNDPVMMYHPQDAPSTMISAASYDAAGTTPIEAVRAFTVSPVSMMDPNDGPQQRYSIEGGDGHTNMSPRSFGRISSNHSGAGAGAGGSNNSSTSRRLRGTGRFAAGGIPSPSSSQEQRYHSYDRYSGGGISFCESALTMSTLQSQPQQQQQQHDHDRYSSGGAVSFSAAVASASAEERRAQRHLSNDGISFCDTISHASSILTPNMLDGTRQRQYRYGLAGGDDNLSLPSEGAEPIDHTIRRSYEQESISSTIGSMTGGGGPRTTATSNSVGASTTNSWRQRRQQRGSFVLSPEEHTVKAILSDASLTQTGKLQLIQQIPNLSFVRQEILQDAALTKTQKLRQLQQVSNQPTTSNSSSTGNSITTMSRGDDEADATSLSIKDIVGCDYDDRSKSTNKEEEHNQVEEDTCHHSLNNDDLIQNENATSSATKDSSTTPESTTASESLDPQERNRRIQEVLRHPTMNEIEKREQIKQIIDGGGSGGSGSEQVPTPQSQEGNAEVGVDDGNDADRSTGSTNHEQHHRHQQQQHQHIPLHPFLTSIQEGDNESQSRVTIGTNTSSNSKSGATSS